MITLKTSTNHIPQLPADLTAAVVRAYREARGKDGIPMNPGTFAEELNAVTAPSCKMVSRKTITNWEHGNSLPQETWLQALLLLAPAPSWQAKFARDLRAARNPGLYKPGGRIGNRIITGSLN